MKRQLEDDLTIALTPYIRDSDISTVKMIITMTMSDYEVTKPETALTVYEGDINERVDVINVGQYCGFVGDMINAVTGIAGIQPKEFTAGTLSGIIGPIINIFVVVPINFVINKFWAYRQKKLPSDAKVSENNDDITSES